MTVSGRRLSRLELGLIAAALLLPVPLVALNGYAAALPAAVERGLGSLVTLEAGDDRSGLEMSGQADEDGSDTRRSADGSLAITRAGTMSSADDESEASPSGDGEAAPSSSDDSTPKEEPSDGADDAGGSGPSGESGGASGDGEGGSSASSGDTPGLSLTIGGGGTGTGVSAGSNGVAVELGADSEGAGSGDAGTATVEVTDQDGSSTGITISVPGIGSAIP